MKIKNRLGFIGFGRMGGALAEGALAAEVVSARQIIAYDIDGAAKSRIKKNKLRAAKTAAEVVDWAEVIFLCVKPQQMDAVLNEMGATPLKALLPAKCLVSIAAGVTLAQLARNLGDNVPLIRVMPNTPALLRNGMSVMSAGGAATGKHTNLVKTILASVGEVAVEPEHLMDAVTAVSGSGPAYVFYLAEAMTEAAQELGLSADLAARLVRRTIFGAGQMLGERSESAEELRKQVTSPGGTTAAATAEFDARGFKGIVAAAIKKAAERSMELSSD